MARDLISVRASLGPVSPHPAEAGLALSVRVKNAMFRAELDARAVAMMDPSKHWSNNRSEWDATFNEAMQDRLAEIGVRIEVVS